MDSLAFCLLGAAPFVLGVTSRTSSRVPFALSSLASSCCWWCLGSADCHHSEHHRRGVVSSTHDIAWQTRSPVRVDRGPIVGSESDGRMDIAMDVRLLGVFLPPPKMRLSLRIIRWCHA